MKTDTFILAPNRTGRPTLMHKRDRKSFRYTACGVEMSGWSRVYMAQPILEILCRKCERM